MADKVNSSYVARSTNITFETSQTLRNEVVNIDQFNTDFVIDINGAIYKLSEPMDGQATVTIVGGLDTFVNEKIYREPLPYLTQLQKNTLYSILKELATFTDAATVQCSNDTIIDDFINSAYFNFCG